MKVLSEHAYVENLGGRRRQMHLLSRPMFYPDGRGGWNETRAGWKEKAGPDGSGWTMDSGPYTASFAPGTSELRVQYAGRPRSWTLRSVAILDADGAVLWEKPITLGPPTLVGGRLFWPDIAAGMDFSIAVGSDQVRTVASWPVGALAKLRALLADQRIAEAKRMKLALRFDDAGDVGRVSAPRFLVAGERQAREVVSEAGALEERLPLDALAAAKDELEVVANLTLHVGASGIEDTSLSGWMPDQVFGADPSIILYGDTEVVLFRCDISALPPGMNITSGVLSAFQEWDYFPSSSDAVPKIHSLLRSWVEAEATHNLRSTGNPWDGTGMPWGTPGFDYTAVATDQQAFVNADWMHFDVTADVAAFHAGTLANNGHVVRCYDGVWDVMSFTSVEGPEPQRPYMDIEYEEPAVGSPRPARRLRSPRGLLVKGVK